MHEPIVGYENARDRSEPDSVARHEVNQGLGRDQNIPWCHGPRTNNGADELTSSDIDVPRKQGRQISGY